MAASVPIPTTLGDGQLAAAKGTLYTATANTSVTSFRLYNTSATPQTVIIYKKPTGTSWKVAQFYLLVNEYANVLDKGERWIMNSGDLIEGETTTANVVNYVIDGATG